MLKKPLKFHVKFYEILLQISIEILWNFSKSLKFMFARSAKAYMWDPIYTLLDIVLVNENWWFDFG